MQEIQEEGLGPASEITNDVALNIPAVSANEACSKQLFDLFEDYRTVIDAFFFLVHLAAAADRVSLNAAKALAESGSTEDVLRYEERKKNPDPASTRLRKYSWYTSRNLVNTIVDSYLTFISSSIQVVLERVPDAIRSGESVKIEDILNFRSRKELLEYLVERKVNALSYGGLNAIEKYLESTLGVSLYREDVTKTNVLYAIEVRNVDAHNRGYVNRIFIDRTKELGRSIPPSGDRAHVDLDLLAELSRSILDSSRYLDEQLSSKFRIRRKKFETWKKASRVGRSSHSEG